MDFPIDKFKIPLDIELGAKMARQSIVHLFKFNVCDLEICKPKTFIRERPFFLSDKLDVIHAFPDGSIRHTPIK